ncbi:MAG: exodeoxyribonuclease V subunit gamma, partial [Victivallaceae bacterium]|nr:exodeoxyribonuclease V subunit gamma [Victivallaceae bacterium]
MEAVRDFEKSNKFHLISSNRLENLTADLVERMNTPCGKAVLAPETIIVQSSGMERYLRLKTAEIQGISANLEFPFPRKFASEYVFRPLLDGKKENSLDPGELAWNIFKILSEAAVKDADFRPLRSYLAGDPSGLKAFQLSRCIANLFEQYAVFRPDIVRKWSFGNNPLRENPHGVWQAELWRKVVPYYNGFHFADLYFHFLKCAYPEIYGESALKTPDFSALKELKRIFLFGFSAMAPVFLDLFFAVSKYVEVYFYYLNPCEAEWQYDLSERGRLHLQVEKADFRLEDGFGQGNVLLASQGGQGREFFALLGSSDADPETCFNDCAAAESLLHKVQRDIQLNENPSGEKVFPGDRSIRIHSCHTPMREIEVLFENLTAMFQADPTLLPKDVLVLTPDINTYSPYIEAVFKSRDENDPRRFPVALADRSQAGASQEAETFLNILKISRSRFKASEVLAIWEAPAVVNAFGLDEKTAALVRQWIIDARIFWGVDGEFREETVGINYSEQSWRQGIERILAGFAFGGEAGDSGRTFTIDGQEILPFHCCEGDSAVLFGKLLEFLEALFTLRVQMKSDRDIEPGAFSADWWDNILNGIIDGFFPESAAALLRAAVKDVLDAAGNSEYDGGISYEIIYDELSAFFEKSAVGGGFLRGGITFCEARPMRSIPARVICMLGLDEKSFPRREKHSSFDLLADKPRLGDRSARKDDRYLFLEALLSARDCFYLSYVGQGVKDNEPRPARVVLCELLDYISENYALPKAELITEHPLQAFSWKYFITENSKAGYCDKLGMETAGDLISYSVEDAELARLRFAEPATGEFAGRELRTVPEELYRINLDELCDFFSDPAKYFLLRCLGTNPRIRDLPELADCESFGIESGLETYKLAENIIRKYLTEWDKRDRNELREELRRRFQFEGLLPLRAWGDIEFEKFFAGFEPFAEKLSVAIREPLPGVSGECAFDNGVLLRAEFDDLYKIDGHICQLQFRYSNIKAGHLIRAAVYEIAAKAMGTVPENAKLRLVGKDAERELSSENGSKKLARLTEIYLAGLRKPLPFFPDTSLAYAKKGDVGSALRQWESGDYHTGDGDNPYI